MKFHHTIRVLLLCTVAFCSSSFGQLLDAKGDLTADQSKPLEFPFHCPASKLVIKLRADTQRGTVTFAILAPDGHLLGSQTGGGLSMDAWRLSVTNTGTCKLQVTPHQAAGHWQVRIDQPAPLRLLYGQILAGALMALVALGSVIAWRLFSGAQWRWFWAGAGIWTVGVALKVAVALPLNPLLLGASGPNRTALALTLGSIYCGLMTGIFEIGVTLAAALLWRRLAAEPIRAVAVGVGAGAFEALLLGLAATASPLVTLATSQTDAYLAALSAVSAHTPLPWLASPVERIIAIACHTAARVLVLRAVAGRRWLGFWAGFALLSAVDLVAGLALLSGMAATASTWWIELMILPFGILSLPVTRWAIAHWPSPAESQALSGHQERQLTP
ncbi:MAG TPA: YhfC family glutamic-type intramembrane protease [Candidatus Sulfotelmatobacter sp.]|nr:YhfC family glutamic-type intramembrane protease [Candidatus Sulfotelmatobacter sp.]